MKHNVGGMDLSARIVVGVILLIAGLTAPVGMAWQIVALFIAAVALVTAALRFCPANMMLGINTSRHEDSEHTHPGSHGPTGSVSH